MRISDLIRRYTIICRNHLTPEIQLHLITPDCKLWYARSEECPFMDPFWAFYWPGGQAISRFVLDNPLEVRNLSVLDLGSGSGACSIACYMSGARNVTANDIDPVSREATIMNAKINTAFVSTDSENLLLSGSREDFSSWDCILVGDMFYDVQFSQQLMQWLNLRASEGKRILVGDPGRFAFISNDAFGLFKCAEYELDANARRDNNGFTKTSVWTFKAK